MSHHLSSPDLFSKLKRKIEAEQSKAIGKVTDEMKRGLEAEFSSILLDLDCVVSVEGEVSEAQRFPETAAVIQLGIRRLDSLLARSQAVLQDLRVRAGLEYTELE
jgi:hypothetical protein